MNKFYNLYENLIAENNLNSLGAKLTTLMENITMFYTEEYIENNKTIPTIQDVEQKFGKKLSIYPTWQKWINTFESTAKTVQAFVGRKGYIYDRDGDIMKLMTTTSSKLGIKSKDAWNPADIWLIDKREYSNIIKIVGDIKNDKDADKNIRLTILNNHMKNWIVDRTLIGVSLKHLSANQSKARMSKFNFDEGDKRKTTFNLTSMTIDFEMGKLIKKDSKDKGQKKDDIDWDDFASQEISFKINKSINAQIRLFPDSNPGNIQIELIGAGEGAREGKIPLQRVVDETMGRFNFERLSHTKDLVPALTNPEAFGGIIKDTVDKYTEILKFADKANFPINKSHTVQQFEDALKYLVPYCEFMPDMMKHLSSKIQGIHLLYIFSQIYKKKPSYLKYAISKFILGARKNLTFNGPFIKIY